MAGAPSTAIFRFFRKLWGVSIPLLVGVALSSASMNKYPLAYTFWVLAGAWGIASWLGSPFLASRRPSPKKRPTPRYRARLRRYRIWAAAGSVVLATACLGLIFLTRSWENEWRLSQLYGRLIPGDDPTPPHSCGLIPEGAVALFLGNSLVIATKFPLTILRVRGDDRLVVDRKRDGSLALFVDVLSPDGRVVAMIRADRFVVNRNNYLYMNRNDAASLEVVDQYGIRVLRARYVNPRAFVLEATLHYAGRPFVLHRRFPDSCFVNVREAVFDLESPSP